MLPGFHPSPCLVSDQQAIYTLPTNSSLLLTYTIDPRKLFAPRLVIVYPRQTTYFPFLPSLDPFLVLGGRAAEERQRHTKLWDTRPIREPVTLISIS